MSKAFDGGFTEIVSGYYCDFKLNFWHADMLICAFHTKSFSSGCDSPKDYVVTNYGSIATFRGESIKCRPVVGRLRLHDVDINSSSIQDRLTFFPNMFRHNI